MDSKADIAKSNFLARVSHEMRTPLNVIIGMSTIAQSTEDSEKKENCLAKISEASAHLLSLINDILDMAKIEAGNLELSYEEFKLLPMLHRTIETARFILDAKKQQLKLDFDGSLPETIISDEQKLSQVLEKLLSNAIKFTPPEGSITVSVKKLKAAQSPVPISTLEFRVSDTGIGISEKEKKNIFALFEQADGTLNRKYEGMGMGLAISSGIIHLMGGDFHVESTPGKGSSFSFEITVEEKGKGAPVPEINKIEQTSIFQGKAIILAEDVEINREIVVSILEDTGLAIECAENGLQALELFKAAPEKYSLILMDIQMPEMDGLEACREIRAFENESNTLSQIPIIAMTANVFKDDVEKCLANGMTDHIGKPIDFEELMKKLEEVLA
jgi:CheY-like chemotaxis protein